MNQDEKPIYTVSDIYDIHINPFIYNYNIPNITMIYGFNRSQYKEIDFRQPCSLYSIYRNGKMNRYLKNDKENRILIYCHNFSYSVLDENGNGGDFIGIEYETVKSMFHYDYTNDKSIQFSSEPPQHIKERFHSIYPEIKNASVYAIPQNMYTTHYVNGNIVCGMWINFNCDNDELEKCNLDEFSQIKLYFPAHCFNIKTMSNTLFNNLDIQSNNNKFYAFVGIELKHFPHFYDDDDDDNFEYFAKLMIEKYTIDNNKDLINDEIKNAISYLQKTIKKSKIKIISNNLQISFIPNMCSCCT